MLTLVDLLPARRRCRSSPCCRSTRSTMPSGLPPSSRRSCSALVLYLFVDYDRDAVGYQFVDDTTWIESDVSTFTLNYAVGVDGLSLPLVALTAFLSSRLRAHLVAHRDAAEGVLRLAPGARDEPARRVQLAGLRALLPLLGGRADPDVLPDLDLGQRQPRVLGVEVRPLHVLRLRVHARRHPRRSASPPARSTSASSSTIEPIEGAIIPAWAIFWR